MRSRVVVADANEMLLAACRAFLTAEGFEVVTVTNGLDCLEALRHGDPCALVIDPEIPWGGFGVLNLMHEASDVPSVPVLILTSHPELITESVLPSVEYTLLIKPVTPSTVARFVQTLVESREAQLSEA